MLQTLNHDPIDTRNIFLYSINYEWVINVPQSRFLSTGQTAVTMEKWGGAHRRSIALRSYGQIRNFQR